MSDTYDGLTAQEWAAKFHALAAERAAELEAVAARQARERNAWRDEWRTVDGDLPADEQHETARTFSNHHDAAAQVAQFGWREMQHRRVTDWRTVPAAQTNDRT